jgi:hypothetical protein
VEEKQMKRLVLMAVFSVVFCQGAGAQAQTIQDLLYHYDKSGTRDKLLVKKQFGDIGDGLRWANMALAEQEGAKPLYCLPPGVTLTRDNYFTLFRRHAEKNPAELDLPESEKGRILLLELQRTFRCK